MAGQNFMDHVWQLLTNGDEGGTAVKEMLFSARDCLGVIYWGSFQHFFVPIGRRIGRFGGEYPTPYRYLRHHSEDFNNADMMTLIVENYQWMPKRLTIQMSAYYVASLA